MLSARDPLPSPLPGRVLVAGVSGVGKSTLARRLSSLTALPYTEIDALFHGPDWTPREEFDAEIAELVRTPAWITEWQYTSARPVLAARAELMVWLDLPFPLTLWRVVVRTVRRTRSRELLWNGNVEPGLWHAVSDPEGIIRWSIATRGKYRRLVPEVEAANPGLTVVRLRSRGAVERWVGALRR
jgi:hypothetical protein